MKSVIVGTAGHIDHGKSTLVWALTGKDPDRLPEEKRRGITIDLGFADLDLGDIRIGFVDVPGHERFVKNMLAGAHGIDVVALVIAADEGVMPQTREHFDICRLLGVRTGLIVITKIDLSEEELIPIVRGEAEELVAGSFMAGAPVLSVSAKTGLGLDELRTALREVAAHVPARSADLVPRLPVDRAFTMKGFGPVVTGTLVSGEISEGDELELLPLGARVRARGLQVHGKSVKQAIAGQRTAVNLGGIDTAAIARGMVLAPTARLRSTQILDVQLNVLPNAPRSLRSRARVRLHIHAAEVLARIHVLEDSGQIAPGESCRLRGAFYQSLIFTVTYCGWRNDPGSVCRQASGKGSGASSPATQEIGWFGSGDSDFGFRRISRRQRSTTRRSRGSHRLERETVNTGSGSGKKLRRDN
jgi:selenocysteine-specific elongation factor